MPSPSHPTAVNQAHRVSFVVSLHLDGRARGLAGPFPTEDEAEAWAVDLIGADRGWTWAIEPLTAPAALPLAEARQRARLARRQHLTVLQ